MGMKCEEHIKKFSKPLTEILNSELLLGNKIAETSDGWPTPKTIIVFLNKPFKKKYLSSKIEFREINDPHYWKSEYFDKKTNHILACKY